MARAAAPTRRMGSQLLGVAVLPPADWPENRSVSSGACSIRTRLHSTSSSSAMSMGSIVFTPARSGVLGRDGHEAIGRDPDERVQDRSSADPAPNARRGS
jgi:hypothetical protein